MSPSNAIAIIPNPRQKTDKVVSSLKRGGDQGGDVDLGDVLIFSTGPAFPR